LNYMEEKYLWNRKEGTLVPLSFYDYLKHRL